MCKLDHRNFIYPNTSIIFLISTSWSRKAKVQNKHQTKIIRYCRYLEKCLLSVMILWQQYLHRSVNLTHVQYTYTTVKGIRELHSFPTKQKEFCTFYSWNQPVHLLGLNWGLLQLVKQTGWRQSSVMCMLVYTNTMFEPSLTVKRHPSGAYNVHVHVYLT